MIKIRFNGNFFTDQQNNKINIEEEEFIEKCLENADVSIHVIEIMRHTLKAMGYELSTEGYRYRNSELFNYIEPFIVKSEKYKAQIEKRKIVQPQKPLIDLESHHKENSYRKLLLNMLRRPRSFSHNSK